MPNNFDVKKEADHLQSLWARFVSLRNYKIEQFIMAGGSGMTFRVSRMGHNTVRALKIARMHLFDERQKSEHAPTSLSPVSQAELEALEKISHPNSVRLYEALEDGPQKVFGISTTFVESPRAMDQYLRQMLKRSPRGVHPLSPQRIEDACTFFLGRFQEIASALDHMHSQRLFHMDLKPANILISTTTKTATLTDLGACIDAAKVDVTKDFRAHFTWTYAHPSLRDVVKGEVTGITGGLKVSATVPGKTDLAKFDLFAFGRTIQELLAILIDEFGERAYTSYSFRYLHLIACLLLDGKNNPLQEGRKFSENDNRRFASDTALNYQTEFFAKERITTARDLMQRLSRWSPEFSWNRICPELNRASLHLINTGVTSDCTFTPRIATVANHPAVSRLKREAQLGWMKDVYPGATHNRWSHSIGVCGAVTHYLNALLNDPDVPTARACLDASAVEHGLLAALLHDVGQTEFGHDFESSCPSLFDHEGIFDRVLADGELGFKPLLEVIKDSWPNSISLDRIKAILTYHKTKSPQEIDAMNNILKPVDGLLADIISGPIDADKFDYLRRDSLACGVPYGQVIDSERFLRALSVDQNRATHKWALALAYKAKGAPAIEALLLARYQMYGSVYWHHTFRCLKAMFVHATAHTFSPVATLGYGNFTVNGKKFKTSGKEVADLFYHFVVTGKPLEIARKKVVHAPPEANFTDLPPLIAVNRSLTFVYCFANERARELLMNVAARKLYRRIFELRVRDMPGFSDYASLAHELEPTKRMAIVFGVFGKFSG